MYTLFVGSVEPGFIFDTMLTTCRISLDVSILIGALLRDIFSVLLNHLELSLRSGASMLLILTGISSRLLLPNDPEPFGILC